MASEFAAKKTKRGESWPATSATPSAGGDALQGRAPSWIGGTWPAFAAVVLVAFVLRLIYVFEYRSSPLFDHPALDPKYHYDWALAIMNGHPFAHIAHAPYFRAPLYSWFLAGVFELFGPDLLIARIVQSLLGAISCGLCFLLAKEAFSQSVGLVAGLAAASYWMLIYMDNELLIPVLANLLNLLLLWLTLGAGRRNSRMLWVLPGLCLGLSAIALPNILLVAPFLAIWIILNRRPKWKTGVAECAVFTAACVAVIAPVAVRNDVVGKDRVLISSASGVNFYIGNNPASQGSWAAMPGVRTEWWGNLTGYVAAAEMAEQDVGRPLKPSEVSRYYWQKGMAFMTGQPRQALGLWGRKIALFWNAFEVSDNQDIYYFTGHYTPIVKYLPLRYGIVAPLGLLGIVLSIQRRFRLAPLWGFVLLYMVSVVMFFVNARYRLPVVPVLICFAAYVPFWAVGAWRNKKETKLVLAAFFVAAMYYIGSLPLTAATSEMQSHSLQLQGVAFWQQGRNEEAAKCLREALKLEPKRAETTHFLQKVLATMGDHRGAAQALRDGLAHNPDDFVLNADLADLLLTSPLPNVRDPQRALEIARKAWDASGQTYPQALEAVAEAHAVLGRMDEAIRIAEQVLEIVIAQGQTEYAEHIRRKIAAYRTRRAEPSPATHPIAP